jgi:hypothetical protein
MQSVTLEYRTATWKQWLDFIMLHLQRFISSLRQWAEQGDKLPTWETCCCCCSLCHFIRQSAVVTTFVTWPLTTHSIPTFWPFMTGLTNQDETRWLLSHLPPLSCYSADHSQFSQVPFLINYRWLFMCFRA